MTDTTAQDATQQPDQPVAKNPVAAAEMAQAAPINEVSSEELPIDGSTQAASAEEIPIAQEPSAADQATAVVEELEVEIRNHEVDESGQRNLALELLRLIRENLAHMSREAAERVQALIGENLSSDYLDPDFWRGLGKVLRYQLTEIQAMIERRQRGEYTTDAYGMDQDIIEIVRPIAAFLYRAWWRVDTEGLEHVPAEGSALLVANRSGMLPWDSAMIATAILEEHAVPRVARTLFQRQLSGLPVLAPALAAFGQVPALPENAVRLLSESQLVTIFPEGSRGSGKLFWDRYKLLGFEAAEYVRAALRTGAPLVPVAVIGAEETYPLIANLEPLARMLGLPFVPVTPLFPWFGLAGLIPLPSKWTIIFDTPITTAEYGPEGADNDALVERLGVALRERIEQLLSRRVAERKSIFFG